MSDAVEDELVDRRSLDARLADLLPIQRKAVLNLITLFALAQPDLTTQALSAQNYRYVEDSYYTVLLNDSDLHTARHHLNYGITYAAADAAAHPDDPYIASRLVVWQLRAADLDASFYYWTCDQAYRRAAMTRYRALEQILSTYSPQTYDTKQGCDHALKQRRHLSHRDAKLTVPRPPEQAVVPGYWEHL